MINCTYTSKVCFIPKNVIGAAEWFCLVAYVECGGGGRVGFLSSCCVGAVAEA